MFLTALYIALFSVFSWLTYALHATRNGVTWLGPTILVKLTTGTITILMLFLVLEKFGVTISN